jgi:hypothetical protein
MNDFGFCKFIFLAVLMTPLFSFSQEAPKGAVKGGSKRTTINFEDQLIKGQNQKPDLLYLLQKKQFNYKRLIRLRDDFLPEMRETATEIQEGRRIQLKEPSKE